MRSTFFTLLFASLVVSTFAQDKSQTLAQLIQNNTQLSNLTALFNSYPDIYTNLSAQKNITIFAPSNDAFAKLPYQVLGPAFATNDTDVITALFQYHVARGIQPSDSFNTSFQFLPTLLSNQTFTNITSGQVVATVRQAGNVFVAVTGLGSRSTLTTVDIPFNNGVLHIIDTFFIPPLPLTTSAPQFNLTSFLGAIDTASLGPLTTSSSSFTIFAPNNPALQALGSTLSTLSASELATLLKYHIVASPSPSSSTSNSTSSTAETVYYTSNLPNGLSRYPNGTYLTSLAGSPLHVTFTDNSLFVNSARVLQQDLLLSNGVLHIIDNILSPSDTTALPNPSLATQKPVLTGSSVPGNILPFTTALPTSTSILFSQVTAAPSTSAEEGSAPTTSGLAISSSTEGAAVATSTKKASAGRTQKVGSWSRLLGAGLLYIVVGIL